MAKKRELGSFFSIFSPFLGHFFPISVFFFFSRFFGPIYFPFLDFGLFSILYQAAWLATPSNGMLNLFMAYFLDIFKTPVTVTPPTRNFKNLKFLKNSLKILNVYFWGTSVYFWGTSVYFWGTGVYFWGTSVYFWGWSGFSGFLEFLFSLLGGFGAPWVGGPRRGFRKYLTYFCFFVSASVRSCPLSATLH